MEASAQHLIRINLPGGIVPTGDLLEILTFAHRAGVEHVRFGNRQQLYLSVTTQQAEDLQEDFFMSEIGYEIDREEHPNMVSSYVTADIFSSASWIREGVYKDILDSFNYRPKLKINLTDSHQSLVPAFTGNFNYITADISNYWYLYIRFPKTNILYCWPSLVYSEDIASLSQLLEYEILTQPNLFYGQPAIDGNRLHELIAVKNRFIVQKPSQALKLPEFSLPCYEGYSFYGNHKCSLGIYRRNELFSVKMLIDICVLCQQSGLGQLYTTPWKSLLIKSISTGDQRLWNALLNRYGINIRHSLNELNWQTDDVCQSGLKLKMRLAKVLDDADQRTQDLCFAIKTQPKTELFGSVIIRVKEDDSTGNAYFAVYHTADFSPNTRHLVKYAEAVAEDELPKVLLDVCEHYYEVTAAVDQTPASVSRHTELTDRVLQAIYHCTHCLTVYDPAFGDDINHIAPGTDFNDLEAFSCPVCESPKEDWALLVR